MWRSVGFSRNLKSMVRFQLHAVIVLCVIIVWLLSIQALTHCLLPKPPPFVFHFTFTCLQWLFSSLYMYNTYTWLEFIILKMGLALFLTWGPFMVMFNVVNSLCWAQVLHIGGVGVGMCVPWSVHLCGFNRSNLERNSRSPDITWKSGRRRWTSWRTPWALLK